MTTGEKYRRTVASALDLTDLGLLARGALAKDRPVAFDAGVQSRRGLHQVIARQNVSRIDVQEGGDVLDRRQEMPVLKLLNRERGGKLSDS